ncbi:MAG: hypothetical protein A3F70_09900 [Acidobacteria bacterium RIFCSPLOWO2_12_FULL_67_14]|nr:MAG: hypothetical protein A3H29_00110 [Acidobacteria bacterium RIFCSPLOWO2_02_FULL_67_21]OFW38064.1 MAG: hypothetical protein A3F70_09900 [Acidobacteria bacterium RIFCSPLOWO2_12_FULL_67_14]
MTPAVLIAIGGIFVLVAVVTATMASRWLIDDTATHRRLRAVVGASASGMVNGPAALADAPDPMLARLTRLIPKSPKDMSRLQRRLTRAGYPAYKAVVVFALSEMLLPVVLGLAALTIFGFRNGVLPALFVGALGYAAPGLYLGRKTGMRQKAIQNGLPDALDLLTVCVEAGSALDQALAKASEELHIAHPALADELRMIVTETRAGKARLEAFRNFSQRTGVEDVRTLVSMLSQTDRFGTSVSDALRVQAETSRTKRRQHAEERANKVGVKLVFPLVLCLFPALYVVCFGPVVVKIARAFFPELEL